MHFVFACAGHPNKNLQWYENEHIEHINQASDSVYNVGIGIMAQTFYLQKSDKNFANHLQLLQKSLATTQKLTIGVEKNTAVIKEVKTPQ